MSNRSQSPRSLSARSNRPLRLVCGLSLSLLLGNALAGCGLPGQNLDMFAGLLGSLPTVSDVKTRIPAEPLTVHPRLWLTPEDVPALRARAVAGNPYYAQGLRYTAEGAKKQMDSNEIPGLDPGQARGWIRYPTEMYAMLFAFMSLVEQEKSARDDYGQRARKLLMHMIDEAVKGAADAPYRHPYFNLSDRSFMGEAFPLTVDWAYPYLTAEDKAKIRTVFLRWIEENKHATVTGEYDHPTPIDLVNDQSLLHLSDPNRFHLRFATNNHFTIHAKNVGLMAMAFDAGDDPDGKLRAQLGNATGAWLYMTDYALDHDAKGGVWPEGTMYATNGMGALAQLMFGLETSGNNDPADQGQQSLWDNPFWEDFLDYYTHSLSPGQRVIKGWEWLGASYEPAFFGDGENYYSADFIKLFGPMALHYRHTGNTRLFDKVRWLLKHYPTGGEAHHLDRLRTLGSGNLRDSITQYMIFDPADPAPPDPRPELDPTFLGGQGRILARTAWAPDASWFSYKLSWARIDHQGGDGNMFELYRKGEWLTKKWVGYGPSSAASEFCNTLAIENDHGDIDENGFQGINYRTGSQHTYTHTHDGLVDSVSAGDDWVYVTGDSTGLYNSKMDEMNDVRHASPALIWLRPDTVFVYDRAETGKWNRFKRFWLRLENAPAIDGRLATASTSKGQQLFIRSLLPEAASLSIDQQIPNQAGYNETAQGEPMRYRLKVEATGGPAKTEFLHVLQGADGGSQAPAASRIVPSNGAYAGALSQGTAVLFPQDLYADFAGLSYAVANDTHRHLVSGLAPNTGYRVSLGSQNGQLTVEIGSGGADVSTDAAGLLAFETVAGEVRPLPQAKRAFKSPIRPNQPGPSPSPQPSQTPGPSSSPSSGPSASPTPQATATPSANVGITAIQVDGYPLVFDPATREYWLDLPVTAYNLGLRVSTADTSNRLYINSNPATAGELVQASTWNDKITVSAIANNWSREEQYLIRIRRIGASPTPAPTVQPTVQPTPQPTAQPTTQPSTQPTPQPSQTPTPKPSASQSSAVPGLTSLTIAGYTLNFNPEQKEYTLTIPRDAYNLALTATTADPSNRLYVNSNPAKAGKVVQASTWHDKITVAVISQNWSQERNYVINLLRSN